MRMKGILTQIGFQLRSEYTSFRLIIVHHLVPLLYYVIVMTLSRDKHITEKTLFSISIVTITLCVCNTLPLVLQQVRDVGILETYRISGISPWSFPIVMNITALTRSLINIVVIFFSWPILLNARLNFPVNTPLYFIALILGALATGAVATFVSSIGMKLGITQFVSTSLVLITLISMKTLPKALQSVLRFLPSNLSVEAVYGDKRAFAIGMLIGMTILFFALSAFMFKKLSMRK